jgi:PadR family transcriptional regulator, regulatory protein PadR
MALTNESVLYICVIHIGGQVSEEKLDLLKGTLDLLVLQILSAMGPMHGYGIARRLEQVSGDELSMNEGTIYASLLRLQHRRLIKTAWGTSENNRRAKYYSLTRAGEKALTAEAANWGRLASVIGRVLATGEVGTDR